MDLACKKPPTNEQVNGAQPTDAWGHADYRLIEASGALVQGRRDLSIYPLEVEDKVTHRFGGTVWIVNGLERVRPASPEEAASLPVLPGFGLYALVAKAENRWSNPEVVQ